MKKLTYKLVVLLILIFSVFPAISFSTAQEDEPNIFIYGRKTYNRLDNFDPASFGAVSDYYEWYQTNCGSEDFYEFNTTHYLLTKEATYYFDQDFHEADQAAWVVARLGGEDHPQTIRLQLVVAAEFHVDQLPDGRNDGGALPACRIVRIVGGDDGGAGESLGESGLGQVLRAVTGDHVIFPSYDGYVYCVNAETGDRIDRFKAEGAVFSSPVVGDGHAFFGDNSGKFYCLNLRGGESS